MNYLDFLSCLIHDLKNPLTSLLLYSNVLKKKAKKEDVMTMDEILSQAEKMKMILEKATILLLEEKNKIKREKNEANL